ncbi:hypothetical protein Pcinc_024326 [Petrolisthes cinctipes]|uniref:DRBM domain-containing protein n=1 Tax=Petrolisthes cinctipes TaxID=88211 RepID=A0AAE1FC93_PETCI|nr:hypothetical protein Pcinc_024326 [Petrolisthes cinctipes]
MRNRGRGRGSWRTNAQPTTETTPAEAFPAPPVNNQVSASMDFYQQNITTQAMDQFETPVSVPVTVPVTDSDVTMQEGGEQQGETRKRHWERPGGVKVKRKRVPGAKNLKIRRYVQPKNAVMCLNELRPGVSYTTEQEGGVGQPFCISVEVPGAVDGQKYRGFGSSKQLAKQAAAEAALISFVKPPVATATESAEEDKTPWATLASFAIYKLFNDWREGRVGMCPPPPQPYGTALPPGMVQAFLNQTMGAPTTVKEDTTTPQATMFSEAISAHLGGRAPNTPAVEIKNQSQGVNDGSGVLQPADILLKVPNPAKQVPDNAATMHPVMVLHQMKPTVQYNVSQTVKDSKPFFTVTTDIDGKEFTGEGTNVKKAKFFLAKSAIKSLYSIDSTFEQPA